MEKYGNKFQLRSDGNRKTLKFFTNNDSLYLNYDPAKSYVDMHIYDMYTGFVKFLVKIPLHGIDNGNELPSCDEIFNHDHDDPNDGTDDISDREYKDKIFFYIANTDEDEDVEEDYESYFGDTEERGTRLIVYDTGVIKYFIVDFKSGVGAYTKYLDIGACIFLQEKYNTMMNVKSDISLNHIYEIVSYLGKTNDISNQAMILALSSFYTVVFPFRKHFGQILIPYSPQPNVQFIDIPLEIV